MSHPKKSSATFAVFHDVGGNVKARNNKKVAGKAGLGVQNKENILDALAKAEVKAAAKAKAVRAASTQTETRTASTATVEVQTDDGFDGDGILHMFTRERRYIAFEKNLPFPT